MADFTLITPSRPAPQTPFGTAEGSSLTLGNFKGKVLLVNLWATWCAPCVEEMPDLDRLQATLGGADFQVLAVSSDRGGAKQVQPFYDRLGLKNLPVYLDPKTELTRALGTRGLPTSILIDREGRMVGQLVGAAKWDSTDALALIRHYIGQPAAGSLQRAAVE
ncbi:MAG: TlpA family protein disulfide reductase [Alphaproteobacteria bacterium]|nr:TlpA family protein disulfide reductase [Alphaproteobacteria bacterium]